MFIEGWQARGRRGYWCWGLEACIGVYQVDDKSGEEGHSQQGIERAKVQRNARALFVQEMTSSSI